MAKKSATKSIVSKTSTKKSVKSTATEVPFDDDMPNYDDIENEDEEAEDVEDEDEDEDESDELEEDDDDMSANEEDEMDADMLDAFEDLDSYEDTWEAGKTIQREDQPIGKFQAEIMSATLGASQSSGRLQITYTLRILAGASKGVEIKKYDGLGSDKQTAMTQGQLRTLGIDPSKISIKQLPVHLLKLQGQVVSIDCKQNGEFYNIYFQRSARGTTSNEVGLFEE